jgi:hypothetical protein
MYDLLEQGVCSTEVFIKRPKFVSSKIDSLKKDQNTLLKKVHSKQEYVFFCFHFKFLLHPYIYIL